MSDTEEKIITKGESNLYLCGRRKIYTSENITKDNVVSIINRVLSVHLMNLQQEETLYWYERGIQPILNRSKEVRPEICNKIVVNNASQIVTFWNGYFMISPASYVANEEEVTDEVKTFNDYCKAAKKHIVDNKTIDWFNKVGLGIIFVEPNKDDKRPFNVYSLDPRSAFVVYSLSPGNRPVMGVNMVVTDTNEVTFDVYTEEYYFKLRGTLIGETVIKTPIVSTPIGVIEVKKNQIGKVPFIEYQYNNDRMCCFENGIPIMDEINTLESNRADAVEQQVQQLMVATNCNFDDDVTANDIRKAGMIVLKSTGENKADFKLLETSLSQSETQVSLDALYEQLLDKTGLPSISRNEGGSSDNGSAVYLKSGFTIADTMRRNTEDLWRESDMYFREVALSILSRKGFELHPDDFDIVIEPPTMSNLLVKTQSAMNMRELGLHPQIWLERSGLSNDPQQDIELSKDYIYKFYETKTPEPEGQALADDRQIEELSSYELD